jgi:CD109 antigen
MKKALAFFLTIFSVVLTLIPVSSCKPVYAAESYLAIIPKTMQSATTQQFSIALLSGSHFASDDVEVKLTKDGSKVASTKAHINGKGIVELKLPQLPSGDYEISLTGTNINQKASVKIQSASLVFMETDKPIYKPGQTVHISVISLDADLRPISQQVSVEVADNKGIKIFRQQVRTDEYGIGTLDLPISEEPNLGVWKLSAESSDKAKTQLDIRVEKYVLPKYEVKVTLPEEWFLASDRISGKVEGVYSFGKAVVGELEIVAKRFVGDWQEYARVTKTINGNVDFELPAVGYVAGTPASGGMGNVSLEFTMREQATGYEEKTTRLLTVSSSAVNIEIIPDSLSFKPGLPLSILLISQNPGGEPVKALLDVNLTYLNSDYKEQSKVAKKVDTGSSGLAVMDVTPSQGAVAIVIDVSTQNGYATRNLLAAYSPTDSFIHVTQEGESTLVVGQTARFKIYATKETSNFYYEVIARGRVVFSDYTQNRDIAFNIIPAMSPSAKLLVYQILPSSEVAADYIPFDVSAKYPQQITSEFSKDEAKPGDSIDLNLKAESQSAVIITAVDKSVFILAENRLNLEQVFAELERLYMQPQAELHEVTIYPTINTVGALDVFSDAGVIVLSNNKLPAGQEYKVPSQGGFWDGLWRFFNQGLGGREGGIMLPAMNGAKSDTSAPQNTATLAEVERIRQFFPETWLWQKVVTDSSGRASLKLTVPDSITTWMLRAVAISKDKGLGVSETSIKAFQPFFMKLDLPYSAIRGEEFPVKVAVYNYLDQPQSVTVALEKTGWFDLLDESQKIIQVPAGDVGSVSFNIRPKGLGFNDLKISARSVQSADAVIQPLLIQPEGVPREFVENLVLANGSSQTIDTTVVSEAITDSGKVLLTLSGSYLTQTLEGLEGLIQMPFGCGEQNMIVFAPDVYIASYLKESGQLKPEIMAKAEKLMITGYQRELTYRRNDGSFSAFGNSDPSGSLWLTAFVLKSFSQAKGLIYVDQQVLDQAAGWIMKQQKTDGSFEAVGFVHHQEMLGGLSGKDALTAYVATALTEAGEKAAAVRAVTYLESKVADMSDVYTVALTSYAFELVNSPKKDNAYKALMALAIEDENGLHWGSEIKPLASASAQGKIAAPRMPYQENRSAIIETTAYAMLALNQRGDNLNAGRAGKWLVSQRNAYGGFGSTQDTVVGLQALSAYASGQRSDVNLTVNIKGQGIQRQITINSSNFDILQVVELPINQTITLTASGNGEVMAQLVRRFNIPQPDTQDPVIKIDVQYDAREVEVNDLVKVSVNLSFNPPQVVDSGMLVVDISVPTGFVADASSIEAMMKIQPLFKRYDISGRKVIFYIDNLKAGAKLNFGFNIKAVYPVKAKGVLSQAYAYYQPEFKGESLSADVTVK